MRERAQHMVRQYAKTLAMSQGHYHELVQGRTSVLVEVPHSGLAIPEEVRAQLNVSKAAIMRDSDIYVDKLFSGTPKVGGSLLVAHASRYVVDLNRAADDVDRKTIPDHPNPRGVQPRGVVWSTTTDGQSVLTEKLNYQMFQERLAKFHTPYHADLKKEISRLKMEHGFAIMLAAHSMPSGGRTKGEAKRADVVPGTRGRSTAADELIDLVDAHFRSAGLSVRHDDPYRGGWSTQHYGRPKEGCHAVQIELNRALYVNEATGEPKSEAFNELGEVLTDLVEKAGRLSF